MTVETGIEAPVSPEGPPRLRLRDFFYVVLLGLAFGLIGSAALGALYGVLADNADYSSVAFAYLAIVIVYVGVALAIQLLLVSDKGISWRELGFRPPRDRFVARTLGVWIVMIVAASIVGGLISTLSDDPPTVGDQLGVAQSVSLSPIEVIILFVAAVAAPALVEEVVFRTLLFCPLRSKWNFWTAAIISAVIFAGTHGFRLVIPTLTILGLGLAWLRERYDSLYPPILLHALNNALAITLFLTVSD